MPELPEVETIARGLQQLVAGATITGAEVRWDRTIRHPLPPERFVAESLRGADPARRPAREVGPDPPRGRSRPDRRAADDRGADRGAGGAAEDRYVRVAFQLADGRQLRYRDVRKFGRIGLWEGGGLRRIRESAQPYRVGHVFARHGPEPLARSFSVERLTARLRRRSARLKTLLLDQSFIAGVGNIYADEALWHARLHPLRAADTLHPDEVRRLHRSIRKVLRQGIANRGASFSDYVGADGEPGANAERLRVYQRTGEPCYRCGRAIERLVIGAAKHPLLPALPAGTIGRGMKVIGLTGNLGCGKSTVAGMLRDLGVATIDADKVTREIRQNDADARAAIEQRFGSYEAAHLAEIVFRDPAALRDLEAILHPLVRGAVRARLAELEEGGVEAAAVEVIKLLESPLADGCDQIWVVRCDEADALARVAASRGMAVEEARRRMASQSSEEEKRAAADVVIDGSAQLDETRRQVEARISGAHGFRRRRGYLIANGRGTGNPNSLIRLSSVDPAVVAVRSSSSGRRTIVKVPPAAVISVTFSAVGRSARRM